MFRFSVYCIIVAAIPFWGLLLAQEVNELRIDSLSGTQLKEVIVISQLSPSDKTPKPLVALDHYLEKSTSINMIRRGGYAWEPFLNGMSSERSVITIDGMRIYGACTDKMDPVTSYVEISNLAKVNIHNGPSGSLSGSTIAGTLELVRKKGMFSKQKLGGSVFSGFEHNNQQKIAGATLSYNHPRFFINTDFMFRNAKNYKAGGGGEVLYSQFTKYNLSTIAGYRINAHKHVEASLIYDRALDVGYPALPMDVSLARAFIGSVEYVQRFISPYIEKWNSKLYYNTVLHIMDDSKRPNVPIHMDMPGHTSTTGFYSTLQGHAKGHLLKANLSGHHSRSFAEMTMYPKNEKSMYMLTWPDVNVNYGDFFIEDTYALSKAWKATFNLGVGVHNNSINNALGLQSLQIFYPDIQRQKSRLLKRTSVLVQHEKQDQQYSFGLAYGERAPSVSEGYGFYLFNNFDRFDYIGNPNMKNEKSVTLNGSAAHRFSAFLVKLSGSYFYIADYIIGKVDKNLSKMTIGSSGVKVYDQLSYAHILNTTLDISCPLNPHLLWTGQLGYRRGTGNGVENLPLIQPFSYNSDLIYFIKSFSASVSVSGAASQHNFNSDFGEKPLPAYAILNLSTSYHFISKEGDLLLKAGVENLLDTNYTTFADWNRIPRLGRNIFINVVWNF